MPFYDNIQTPVINTLHKGALVSKIIKDNQWDDGQFHMVNWKPYHLSLQSIPRSHRISLSKLCNQLWNTNHQNWEYYGQTPLCPACQSERETITHVYSCPHPSIVATREAGLVNLHISLLKHTPGSLVDVLLSGIKNFMSNPGTLKDDAYLGIPEGSPILDAYHNQSLIGWGSLLRGHISTLWHTAFSYAFTSSINTWTDIKKASRKFFRILIHGVWTLSKLIWGHRCSIVHGKTEEFRNSKEMNDLRDKARQLYKKYKDDHFCIPSSRVYLFNRPEEKTLTLGRDALSCWIASVEEGMITQEQRTAYERTQLMNSLQKYLRPKTNRSASVWQTQRLHPSPMEQSTPSAPASSTLMRITLKPKKTSLAKQRSTSKAVAQPGMRT